MRDTPPVDYGNATPFVAGDFAFSLVFDYGDHDPALPGVAPSMAWPARPDVTSNFRAGFDRRCYRLCRRVLMFHRFAGELATPVDGEPATECVRSLDLRYDEDPAVTTLAGATMRGWRWDPGEAAYATEALPEVRYTYAQAQLGDAVEDLRGTEDLPRRYQDGAFQWVDLDGEGLTGLLTEVGGHWYYKRNAGNGAMDPFRRLSSRPSPTLGRVHLVDIDGDGRLEAAVWKRPLCGIVERSIHGDFVLFERFKGLPTNTSFDDPRARMVDLDGDGVADLLIADGNVMRWHPSRRRWGYGKQEIVRHPPGENEGPQVLFHRGGESVFLADMTGDGLSDLVRIRNNEVCYWPNRGYGRFGGKVLLRGSPRFDAPDRFDPRRIRLADIDGTGVADVIYLGPAAVRLWRNQAGNSFGPEQVIRSLPGVEAPNTITVTDLLGDGTACLVWTSPQARAGARPIRYLRLMSADKPYLLVGVDNGLGRTTTLSYTPSTWFYAEDRRKGAPWATRLPFPVHCLSRVEQVDGVTGWRHVSTYRYKHGYFDPTEREFRGFALVEQLRARPTSLRPAPPRPRAAPTRRKPRFSPTAPASDTPRARVSAACAAPSPRRAPVSEHSGSGDRG